MELGKIFYAMHALGIRGITRMLHYSFERELIERKFAGKSACLIDISPGVMQDATPTANGLRINFDQASVELSCLTSRLINITWQPGSLPYPYTINRRNWDEQKIAHEVSSDHCSVSTDNLKIEVSKTGAICFRGREGNLLRYDRPPIRCGEQWKISTILKLEERIFGLGERSSTLNLRPGIYNSWNSDAGGHYSPGADPIYIGTPIYLSLSKTGCYLTYFENSFKSRYTLEEDLTALFEGGSLRYYAIFGPLEIIYEQLKELVGGPFLPPLWALGYHQSRWGYRSEADIRRIVNGFKEHDLPLSAIHLDIDYMDGFRVFTINRKRFPEMKQLAKELDSEGIKLVATINPAIKQDKNYPFYVDGKEKDVFCKLPDGNVFSGVSWSGWSVFPDFTNPIARRWWGEQYKELLAAGIAGIWHDMNEPVSISAWGDMSFPGVVIHDLDGQGGTQGGTHREVHNIYGLLMNKAGYEALQEFAPDKRPWVFSRSGWAGLQRYAWNWTGDVESSWEALKRTIATIIGLSLSGHAFSGVDIGGFSGDPDAELYLRWFQMATFFPLFRTHSAINTKPREPWVFGESTTKIVRDFLNLRYKLLPYWYTLVWESCQTGIPPIRPIFWEELSNQDLWDIDDEFMLGDCMLIAPIISRGATCRRITLPSGLWYSYWDDHLFTGPTQFDIDVTLDFIPLFIKGGAILPMELDNQLYLHIYPKNMDESAGKMYFDKGDGYGSWRIDTFTTWFHQDSMEISWNTDGDYAFPYPEVKLCLHHKKLKRVLVDNMKVPFEDNTLVVRLFRNLALYFE